METKKIFYKNYKANQPKERTEVKDKNNAVICSQMFISSQSKLSIKSKSSMTKVLKLTNLNDDMEEKVKIIWAVHFVTI